MLEPERSMKICGQAISSDQQLFYWGLDSRSVGTVVAAAVVSQPWRLDGYQCKQNKSNQGHAKKALRLIEARIFWWGTSVFMRSVQL